MIKTSVAIEQSNALFFKNGEIFASHVPVESHQDTLTLLGSNSIAYRLRDDIILWYSADTMVNECEHTLSVSQQGKHLPIYGDVLIASDDEVEGIAGLSYEQKRWLAEHSELIEVSHYPFDELGLEVKKYILLFKQQ